MHIKVGLDFETYAGISLPDHGLDRYVSHETFRPLIACGFQQNWAGDMDEEVFDFVEDYYTSARSKLENYVLEHGIVVAHNAPFEERVLRAMKIDTRALQFRDSAVVARAYGAGGKLEAAAPQLLDSDKYEPGRQLMRLFSMPGKYQEANGSLEFDPLVVEHHPAEWAEYKKYCGIDAMLGYQIDDLFGTTLSATELENMVITQEMNEVGWPVDIDMVHEMQRRYLENQASALAYFRHTYEQGVEEKDQLNFASFQQMKKWCEARGVKAKSFDEEHVAKYLAVIRKRLHEHGAMPTSKRLQLLEVEDMLTTKQILGGSSLKKLQAILNQVGEDGRLRGQYLHIGAGQTWRTSGRGVQMQNLKQLREVKDMDELEDEETVWNNEELARNLRQVFTASRPDGQLIVGDFSSVESRGLAYMAGATWKLDAFRKGLDMYKVLAAKIDGTPYDNVTKERRQFGKVGELSCGYQAGSAAVQAFAKKMGTDLTTSEAAQLVNDWRSTNREVVELWSKFDKLLRDVVADGQSSSVTVIGGGLSVEVTHAPTPASLARQHPGARSIVVSMRSGGGTTLVHRYFHGCYVRGNSICFYKPSDTKSGDPWKSFYRDPKTKEIRFFSIYGGKLTGILTQSLCREMFFRSLRLLKSALELVPNVQIIGQFHDEIVLDWWPDPDGISLGEAKSRLAEAMSDPSPLHGFPLVADIKHDYRYTK